MSTVQGNLHTMGPDNYSQIIHHDLDIREKRGRGGEIKM
jgi:hypothetical protein